MPIFIVSAPSGAGKTTLCRAILPCFPDLAYSVSYTTRKPRKGETEGVDYHFISDTVFQEGIARKSWAEWAEVHGHFYGTSTRLIDENREAGKAVLLDIDVQGARQLYSRYPESVTIFITAPSLKDLEKRLVSRKTDPQNVIDKRIEAAEKELAQQHWYRYLIVNDELSGAERALYRIIASYGIKGRLMADCL